MPTVLTLAGLFLVISVPVARGDAELRFLGQTHFVVNETSRTVVRLVVERAGDPINVTALVLLEGDDTGDFEATTAAAFLLSTETNKTIFIAVRDDDLPEADETFTFTLKLQSSSNGVTVGTPNTATITILSNDNAFGIISFNSSSLITVNEPRGRNQYVPLSLIREKGTYGSVTVHFEIVGGPNPASEDLSPDKGNITIPPGRAVVVFSILIHDDQLPEDDETFTVQLTDVAGGALINPNRSSVQIKINRNDSPLRITQTVLAVPEVAGVVNITVTRGRNEEGRLVGSDAGEIAIDYAVVSGNGTASATLGSDFQDLQANRTLVFPAYVYEAQLRFAIVDDVEPEIAESFQVVLLEDTLRGDGVLLPPGVAQVTIEPNDKPYGVLSISSTLLTQTVIINEDSTLRFDGIYIVRNGGTHGDVSVNWTISRNSTDRSPVTDDLRPPAGTLQFAAGQMSAAVPLNVTDDALPEEAEAFIFRLLPGSVRGGAQVDDPMEMVFYIQDSDDVYGLFRFHPAEEQRIQSQPSGRFLSLSFLRERGTLGDVRLGFTALYIPAGLVDPTRARDGVLNGTRANSVVFFDGQSLVRLTLPIRNDAFLQNGAHFVIQLDSVDLVNINTPIPPVSPRFGGVLNISLRVTQDIANGEIGFTTNQTVVLYEPEDNSTNLITLPLRRDGTDGRAVVFWSLRPTGFNQDDVTPNDLGPFSGSVTFLSGESDASINITVYADVIPEINETILLTLDRTNVENQILKPGFTSREIVIVENDDPGGVFEFLPRSRGPWTINEGETVELRVVRSQGQLLSQLVRYEVMPMGNTEFYGATGIMEFKPGEREVVVALVARPDGVPELDETFSVVLSSYSTPPSRLGTAREVNITVRQNDDPFGVIEFIRPGLAEAINESKGLDSQSASYLIVRNRGTFGEVSVLWVLEPRLSGDVSPVQGSVVFREGEYSKNLTLFSLPDEIPEDTEDFTITLLNATGGARLGNVLNASLRIRKNDDPIYFAEPVVVRVREGGVANFTVLRAGPADFIATVMYQFTYGDTSPGDFIPQSNDSMLVFSFGEWMKNISVATVDDDIPETDEPFYIILYNATGDAVVYGATMATVVIEANDDANGIFSLEPVARAVEEGKSNNFYVVRDRGPFGNVTVYWQLFANDTALEPGQEFVNVSGSIIFTTGEVTKPIVLQAISDKMPEFNEFYTLRLMNVSGGYPGDGGRLAMTNLSASVLIPFNDDPFGVFAIDAESLDREVAEDVLSEDDMSDVTSFTILRQQGTFGVVRVAWEILSDAFPLGLPPMDDLILSGSFPPAVDPRPHMRRHHSATDALFFSGLPGAYGTIGPDNILGDPQGLANFTFSAWLMPSPNTDGFIVSKGSANGTLFYGVKIQTNESHVTLMLLYSAVGSNSTQVARATASKFVEDNVWVHVLIALDDGIIEFYLDGNLIPGGIKSLKGEAISNGPVPVRIGSNPAGEERYTGLLQDARLYSSRLSRAQIHELHGQPAKTDLRNVSGYLEYRQDERRKSFVVEVRDDLEEEGEETFYLQLVAVHGGARLPDPRPTAMLRVQKSDNANGLFGFTGACIPDTSEEGSTISCVVERTRGSLDYVYVNYTVSQIDSGSSASPASADFANATGAVLFLPGQRSEVLNLLVLDDDVPEFAETFRVTLVAAESGDGKAGSTPTSGASIDPDNSATTVTVKASDHPYGLLQFSTVPLTEGMIRPATEEAHITVMEEAGEIRLLVARAQGLLGRVMVGYRTVPLTAVSPQDYEDTEGVLDFLPGERHKYISVTIIDNPVPELDKVFRVELYNPDGGVDQLIRSEGSGSGEGEADFFLPSFHQHASLGIASHITVTIAASDDAHGVFQFSKDSLNVNGTEPEEGHSSVVMQVERSFGALSNVTLFWEADPRSEEDLVYRTGNVTFAVGQTKADIVLRVAGDDIPELDKSFSVILSNVSHGRLGNLTNATLTVLASDDPYGLFVFSERSRPVRVPEADADVTLTMQRQRGLMGSVRVTYATLKESDTPSVITPGVGRASPGSDFVALMGSVTFAANQSEANITLRVLDDEEPERAESIFVELISVQLVKGVQDRPIALSPRLGPRSASVAQVIVEASDDAFGVLQLSSPAVSVAEHYVGPIVNVTRVGGIFADVSVKFRAVPMTARVGDDYSVASSDVVLLEGETSKPVPIYIINDIIPELEETFRIELLNQTTGGAMLGTLTETIITILPSDDPWGSFVFQAAPVTMEEPGSNPIEISLPIVRNAGTLGQVSVRWRATVNGQLAVGDLRPVSGEVSFAPGETMKTLRVEVLPDDVPEIEEIIRVELTSASNGGSIGSESFVNIIIPANDNPYGTVYFEQSVYRVQEPLEGAYIANVTVRRSGGNFGRLEILYRTLEIDVVSTALTEGQDLLIYYEPPAMAVPSSASRRPVNITGQRQPLVACAAFCLRERACRAFSFSNTSGAVTCDWVSEGAGQMTSSPRFLTYVKNATATTSLFSSQAVAGSDYLSVTAQTAVMLEGAGIANLTVPILTDSLPEVDESFMVQILKVDLVNLTTLAKNRPSIGQPDTAVVTIGMNGDAFGVFLIYSISPNATEKGLYLEVREEPRTSVLLVIERRGGSLGQVTVEWKFVGGTATPNADFNGTGETLTFKEGDLRKVIELFIVDDTEPEDNETLRIGLVKTEGGSRILPSSDTVTVVILANDHVAGMVGFHTSSRSVIAREGERLQLLVVRTGPGRGNVTVDWSIQGPRVLQTFTATSGVLFFSEGSLNDTVVLQLLDDAAPEDKEEYRVTLSNIRTQGVIVTGIAVLDVQGREAVVTVEASDEPYGILSIAPSSLRVTTEEKNVTLKIFINREFGASGVVNISYETVRGSLQDLTITEGALADPGQDYVSVCGSVLMQDGQTSVAIPIIILDDDIPELQEFFLVNITSAVLITSLASPPKLDTQGLVAEVSISANDGVRGIIEWQSTHFEVNETIGVLTLVAYRNRGTYGNVSLFFYAQNLEAQQGLDFNATSSILHFADGERHKFIEVQIFDDNIPEGDEKFQLILANPSFGLELGHNTTATVTILTNDDGRGVISFNNSEHFFLQEPTSLSGLGQSVATLYVVRDPPQGTFGTVSVQFVITDVNGSLSTGDLMPSQGFVVLEDGVRFKTLEIWAVLDEEPEMNETFTVTLFSPAGGARLGDNLQTMITVLQNQAPLGLFRIFPSDNRTASVTVEEGNRTVYLTVSRSNGLETAVSVEWEAQSNTAFGMKGELPVLAVYQSLQENLTAGWCEVPNRDVPLALRMGRTPAGSSSQTLATLYRWQGVFVPLEFVQILGPRKCVGFVMNGTSYTAVTHGGRPESGATNVSLFRLQPDMNLTLEQTLTVEAHDIRYFSVGSKAYLIASSQVLVETGGRFVPHQNLGLQEVLSLSLFPRGSTLYLVMSIRRTNDSCLLYQWSDGQFRNPQPLPIAELVKQVESFRMGGSVYLLLITEGPSSTCEVLVWGPGNSFFQHSQSILLPGLVSAHSFTPPSGITHLLLAGGNGSALYSWRSDLNLFSVVSELPPAQQFLSIPVTDLNATKSLIVATGDSRSIIYELTSVSNQSDFIPSFGELRFEPGDAALEIAVNVLDDTTPEEEESFRVRIKNPKGGAEIGFNSQVTVVIPPNDDAYGIVGFAQSSLSKEADELGEDNLISLTVERKRGTFGRLTVHWAANGSLADIFPTSGVVTFSASQALAVLSLTVLADNVPEMAEKVTITLTGVTTVGIEEQWRGAVIDPQRAYALITILPNGSPYGVIGWHSDSQYVLTQEPQRRPTNITLTIVREQGFVGDVEVRYATRPALSRLPTNQATENEDYVGKEEMVVMKENIESVLVTITVLPDDIPELAESFLVNISSVRLLGGPQGAGQPSVRRAGMEVAEITIQENDDPRGVLQFNVSKDPSGAVLAYEVPPPGNLLQIPIVRLAGRIGRVVAFWEAQPILASQEDFTPASGNITFQDGEGMGIIEITITDDNVVETLETFTVTLIRVTGGARLGNESEVTVNIPPNDSPLGMFGFKEQTVTITEPQFTGDPAAVATLTVVRSPGGMGEVHLGWVLESAARDDLTPLNGTLIFSETESQKVVMLRALADTVLEGDERFTVQLLSIRDEAVIDPMHGVATIVILGDRGALGTVAIAESSRNILIGEPQGSYNGTAVVSLVRGPGIFGEILVYWNIIPAVSSEFEETSGVVTMRDRQSAATIRLKVLDDDVPEERRIYQLVLTNVTGGADISPSGRQATVTMAASDFPYGLFSFAQAFLQASEEQRTLNVTVLRYMGTFGTVWLYYETVSSVAVSGSDFLRTSGRLLFGPSVAARWVSVEILDDALPEGPEEFYLNITRVELLNDSNWDFTVREHGLQLDQPPAVGNVSAVTIVIQKSDNAEGILEFDPDYVNMTVEEDVGTIVIPVVRRRGSYGQVTADFISRGLTALPGLDYILPNGSVTFSHGQNLSYINVSIVDDPEREYSETFEIQLSGASGGAVLGAHLVARITIAKSDSPSGIVRFLNQSLTIKNPNSTMRLTLALERTGGLVGEATIKWNILGPNSNEVLPSINTDIGEPVNGSFHFRDGEGGLRTIELTILPHGEVEVEETFVVMLGLLSGDTDIDPRAGSFALTIEKFGDPNGIVQFVDQDLIERTYNEPDDMEGPLSISLRITRREGVMGNITVFWVILSDSDTTGDFSALRGSVTIPAGQRNAEVRLLLLPDSVPELEEVYTVRLSSVEGGAELDANRSSVRVRVRANDEPHGVFALYSDLQAVAVSPGNQSRHIALNITRHAGAFGNVSVEYRITANGLGPGQDFLVDTVLGNLLVKDGASSASVTVPVSKQVFFATGFSFSVELMEVSLVGLLLSSPPRILLEAKTAIVTVPEEAANSEVGFESLTLEISSFESGHCEALVFRRGLYGDVDVDWRAGYPPGQTPVGFQQGQITPNAGMVRLLHGERNRTVSLTVVTNVSSPEAFAVHLAAARSDAPGGARLRSGFTVAEVEPLGVYQFAPDSRKLVVEEDVQTVTLYVQRLFGFRSNRTRLTYETWDGSANAGVDYVAVRGGELLFDARQNSAAIPLSIRDDQLTEQDETFYVNLTDAQVLSGSPPSARARPRLLPQFSVASITILANDAVSGWLSIGPALVRTPEDRPNGTQQQTVTLRVRRTAGHAGAVRIGVRAYGGGSAAAGPEGIPFTPDPNATLALEGEDFLLESGFASLQDGQVEAEVTLVILDDLEPEGQEVFFIYLTDPEGGAQIVGMPDEHGFTSFAKIIILGSDLQNGIVGFSVSSQTGHVLDEDSEQNRTAMLVLQRQENRVFEDVTVFWRVTFSTTSLSLVSSGVNLTKELASTSGSALCRRGEVLCAFAIEARPDQEPEYESWFLVEIYQVGAGAAINESARFANVTVLESDDPRGLVYFAVGSRLPVVHQKSTRISLQVYRQASTAAAASVRYRMQELPKAEAVGPTLVWPAVGGMDFVMDEGALTFDIGQRSAGLDVILTPDSASSNPPPKRFRVLLSDATGGARVHPEFGVANVTLVSDTETQAVWALLDQLHQPLDETVIDRVLQGLLNKVTAEVTREQLTAVLDALGKVLTEAEKTPLKDSSRALTYDLLCAMANPSRADTRGLSQLSEVEERFALSLVTGAECGAQGQRGRTIWDSCPFFTIAAHHWYPTQINGHTFTGTNSDTFRLPEGLLEVPVPSPGGVSPSACRMVQFTEYSTEHWFLTSSKPVALNNKVFSVSLKGRGSRPLSNNNEVVYRIHTPDRRIKPRQSVCLLWNQAAESWLSDGQFCRVVDDSGSYVECACSHLSVYTAFAETDTLSSYNEAFYASGFICISGFILAIVSHVLCSRFPMFAAKLLAHMMVACLGTQICFLVSAFRGRLLSDDSCAALGLFSHYFHLSQFSWMLIQAVNFWQVLVMNDEHTEQRYLLYFLLSWGLPALVIVVLVIVLLGGYSWNIHSVYGLVQGDLCFIPNVYASLCTAALVPLICLVGVFVVFIHAYQVTQQWKAYDDVFRGRTNSTEVPMVLILFSLVSVVWLWAGLHMAYRYLWMLILYVIFNCLLGLYVFVVYFIMHNQLCWPGKASYTVGLNGHGSPDSAFQAGGTPTVGGDISKSTQNLISAMEEVSADWERASLRRSSQPSGGFKQGPQNGTAYTTQGGFINTTLTTDEESQEFDDLIFALKTGSGLNVSDTESIHGSQDGGSVANSQIVELRRIPIADTHL
ncbi:LOW QUALITY PROTEIN: adhesion G-protein coupled receptor V1 [Megalops cyprinoides]|uniref:LOW QUALITY PROTEIN: adhesion G-protein coupled receptor V1 n=1 Tax=Megalops cyprinoides TaxID=118141 RepID=UPI0018650120|nr:LOW QUALITY PROTEIN: adhesion G-protein coupled receptor V1 [Megalops cyprinoides]